MKIFNSNIRKLSLSIALVGMTMVGQSVWACVNPDENGDYYKHCADAESGILLKDNKYIDSRGNNMALNINNFYINEPFNEGRAVVGNGLYFGVIDSTGKLVVPYTYQMVALLPSKGIFGVFRGFKEGMLPVARERYGSWGFIDKTGKEVVPIQYNAVWHFSKGLAKVRLNNHYGFIDKSGREVIPIKYDSISQDYWGDHITFLAKRSGRQVVIAKSGIEYDGAGILQESRVWVSKNGLYGYIDDNAKEVIPLIYQGADSFSNGLASVKKDEKWGYIDTNGKTLIDFQYEYATSFENGKARVAFGDDGKSPKYFYIDKTGKILTDRSILLADFRKKLEQGDDVSYQTNDDFGRGMIFEIKGNLVQVQTKESQCSQRDYKGNCQNYIENQVGKWVKKSEVYPINHFD